MDSKYTNAEVLIRDIGSKPIVLRMKQYRQHGRITTYDHCVRVARLCYKINQALHLNSDIDALLKGAMLHDFYLYDWHCEDNGSHRWHGFSHARKAAQNANKYFHASRDIQHIIECHMWPLNITKVPRSREAWLVCLADKYASVCETLFKR